MQIARDLPSLRAAAAGFGAPLALVPTMGALHDGHLALVTEARRHAPRVAVSIFVNPLQFGPAEDLSRYPRQEAADLGRLRDAGCDLAWLPTPAAMYPPDHATTVEPGADGPAAGFEGTMRPGHFRGVATVCAKLFLQTGCAAAVFGEKDWQQLQVVRRMVADLDLPVRIVPLATVREADGLALSSRNRFLGADERVRAPALHAALVAAADAVAAGVIWTRAGAAARAAVEAAGMVPDYLALVEAETMRPWGAGSRGRARIVAAARLGSVRLLDNVPAAPRAE